MRSPSLLRRCAFTLLEIVLALFAGAIILAAIYGFFSKAVHMRQDATVRTRESRQQSRAAGILRNDLRGAIVTGGLLASILEGSAQSPSSNFPGYLKFATTTARDEAGQVGGDVQQVEYFVADNPAADGDPKTGALVRTIERDPLSALQTDLPQETVLSGVSSMEVAFYDGAAWTNSWRYSADATTLPEAVRVVIRRPAPASPIEVEVPWQTQPETEPSPSPSPAS